MTTIEKSAIISEGENSGHKVNPDELILPNDLDPETIEECLRDLNIFAIKMRTQKSVLERMMQDLTNITGALNIPIPSEIGSGSRNFSVLTTNTKGSGGRFINTSISNTAKNYYVGNSHSINNFGHLNLNSNIGMRNELNSAKDSDLLGLDLAVAEAVSNYSLLSLDRESMVNQREKQFSVTLNKRISRENSISVEVGNLLNQTEKFQRKASIDVKASSISEKTKSSQTRPSEEISKKFENNEPKGSLQNQPMSMNAFELDKTIPTLHSATLRKNSIQALKANTIPRNTPAIPPALDPSTIPSKPMLSEIETSLVKDAKVDDEGSKFFFIHPYSFVKATWDFTMSVFYIFIIFFVPIFSSFPYVTTHVISFTSIAITAVYITDMIIIAFSRKIVDSVLISLPKSRKKVFLSIGFVLDIISTIPFDIIFRNSIHLSEILLLLRCLRVRWFMQIIFNNRYTWAYFTAISNTFPVTGYRPTDPVEVWITIISILIGAVLFAVLVGTISSFSFGLDSSGRQFRQKMDEVNEYMSHKKLNDSLKLRINQYYELKYRGKYFDETGIMNELNESLRTEIARHNSSGLIVKVPFLRRDQKDGRDELFMCRIANALKPVYYISGDVIFEQGRVGNEMFFILSGMVEIVVNSNIVGKLTDGAFFGEVALLGQTPRTATIRAGKPCVLYTLDRKDFDPILADFDDMAIHIQQVYQERMQKIRMEREVKIKEIEARKIQAQE
ncbi:hypothetical protein HK096_006920 [Nowakowskiella sp. JEL0078]|nr:hypothetical protein HK096_006920 [Nowakowskiella sp. JEL0078]